MSSFAQLHRHPLNRQVVEIIRKELISRRWREWMPSERTLLQQFNVSRQTMRDALKRLVADGVLTAHPRRGYRIVEQRQPVLGAPSQARNELGLICPEYVYSMPPYVIKVVDIVRRLCAEAGMNLEVFEGRRIARSDPGRLMPKLVKSFPKACWIVMMADERLQRWFERSGTPVVIYGNVYPGINLPAVGIDYRACIRHAASLLLGRGHRRIVLVTYDQRMAGEKESLAGFQEAFRMHTGGTAVPLVLSRRDDDVQALCRQIDRLIQSSFPPTAFIVCRTHHYVAVASHLASRGKRIPRDVSLICRGEDTFLHFLSPRPAFYRVNIETIARSLFNHLLDVVNGLARSGDQLRKVPDLVVGESLAAAPPAPVVLASDKAVRK